MKTTILKNGSPVAHWDVESSEISTKDPVLKHFFKEGIYTRTGGTSPDGKQVTVNLHVEPTNKQFPMALYDALMIHGFTLPPVDAKQLTDQFLKKKTKQE